MNGIFRAGNGDQFQFSWLHAFCVAGSSVYLSSMCYDVVRLGSERERIGRDVSGRIT